MGTTDFALETLFSTGDIGQGAGAVTWLVADVDGDGRAELVQGWNNDGHLALIVYQWNTPALAPIWAGDTTGAPSAVTWLAGDVNGDGRAELIQLWDNGGKLSVNVYGWLGGVMHTLWSGDTGQGIGAESWLVGDVNGDGRVEIVQVWNDGGKAAMIIYGWVGGELQAVSPTGNLGQGSGAVEWLIADVNGDGRQEVLQLWNHGGKLAVIVYGWVGGTLGVIAGGDLGESTGAVTWLTGDVNGDGRAEVVQAWNDNGRLGLIGYGWVNNQLGVLFSTGDVGQGAGAVDWQIGDVNGDGRAEILQQWNNDGRLAVIAYGWTGSALTTQWSTGDTGQGAGAVDWAWGSFTTGKRDELLQLWSDNGRLGAILYGQQADVSSGQVKPSYQVLFVAYAPPGANGGKGGSSVDYGTGSTCGTTTTTAGSFQTGTSVTASAKGGVLASASVSATFDFSATVSDSSSIDLKKSVTTDFTIPGPGEDGIDHDKDHYYLWLNPVLDVTLTDGRVTWGYDTNSGPINVEYVEGGWLKNPATMPPGVLTELVGAGIKPADYAQILATNPFSGGATVIDPGRFSPIGTTFPYEPPDAGDAPSTAKYVVQSSNTETDTNKAELDYGVSFSISGGLDLVVFTAELKVTDTFKWTNSLTFTSTSGSSQSATCTIGGPATGYTGPTGIEVYSDAVYGTFLFTFVTTPATDTGNLTDSTGKPVAGKEVILQVGARTYRTFTDSKGVYRFYGPVKGEGTLTVDGKPYPASPTSPTFPTVPIRVGTTKPTLE
jgi:FG-GAP-like repeat